MRLRKLSTLARSSSIVAALAAVLAAGGASAGQTPPAAVYKVDASRSTFVVRAFAGGPLWFKGQDHIVAARDFTGEARLTPGAVTPASLTLTVRAASLAETREVFDEQEKKIIDGELRDVVLESDKYPEITFRSTDVAVEPAGGDLFRLKLGGDLTLRGVTRHVSIPVEVTLRGGEMRARGEFNLKRSDFKVPTTSAARGTVRVRDRLKISFDIVARRD